MNERIWQGWWWRPDDLSNAIPGTLTTSADGRCTLSLIGGFDLAVRRQTPDGGVAIMSGSTPLKVLLGQCGSTKITLTDCIESSSEGGLLKPAFQQLIANSALIGTHLADLDHPHFTAVVLRLENLQAWTLTGGWKRHDDPDPTATMLAAETQTARHRDFVVSLMTKRAGFRNERRRDSTHISGDMITVIRIDAAQPIPLNGFNAVTHALTDLMTFASSRPCGIIEERFVEAQPLLLEGPDDTLFPVESQVERLSRKVHLANAASHPQDHHYFLFTCADRPFDQIIPTWLTLREQIGSTCNVLFGLQYARPTYHEFEALGAAIATESLHAVLYKNKRPMSTPEFNELRDTVLGAVSDPDQQQWLRERFFNAFSFRQRMEQLAGLPNQAAVDYLISDRTRWIADITSVRNGLAHSGGHKGPSIDLFELARTTAFLVYLVIMQWLELDGSLQLKAVQNNGYLSVKRAERAMITGGYGGSPVDGD